MKGNPRVRLSRFDAAGFTLVEISLVISLIVGLIALIFFGLGINRQGVDRATCRMHLAAVQKAIRSYANFNNLRIADPLLPSLVFGGAAPVIQAPTCAAGGLYTWQTTVPAIGVSYGDCSVTNPAHSLVGTVDGW